MSNYASPHYSDLDYRLHRINIAFKGNCTNMEGSKEFIAHGSNILDELKLT